MKFTTINNAAGLLTPVKCNVWTCLNLPPERS